MSPKLDQSFTARKGLFDIHEFSMFYGIYLRKNYKVITDPCNFKSSHLGLLALCLALYRACAA